MIHLILTDFDGTLFPKSGGELSQPFIQKIKNLTDRGTLFAVNSGRPYGTLKKLLEPIINRTFFICNDGAQIMYKNCLLYKKPVCRRAAKRIFSEAISKGLSPFASLREKTLPVTDKVLSNPGLFGEDFYKIILEKNNAAESDLAFLKNLGISCGLRVCFEDSLYLELCDSGADKGIATAFLKKKYGISKGVAAFGDTKYDFSMFDEADKVYLMKTAKDVLYPGARVIDSMQNCVVEEF